MDEFIAFLKQVSGLSSESQQAIREKLVLHHYPRHHVLVQQGATCNRLYFVLQGLGRVYHIKEGKEITDWFAPEGAFISSIVGFFAQQPSTHVVELLEPSTLVSITNNDLNELYLRHHDIERAGRLLAIDMILKLQARIDSIQFETAQQRYENLLKNTPTLLQRVPLGHIASYLGITQVTLSRIRTKNL